jgi:hypothetical protein
MLLKANRSESEADIAIYLFGFRVWAANVISTGQQAIFNPITACISIVLVCSTASERPAKDQQKTSKRPAKHKTFASPATSDPEWYYPHLSTYLRHPHCQLQLGFKVVTAGLSGAGARSWDTIRISRNPKKTWQSYLMICWILCTRKLGNTSHPPSTLHRHSVASLSSRTGSTSTSSQLIPGNSE